MVEAPNAPTARRGLRAAARGSTDEIRFDVASVWVGEGVPDVEIFEDAF